MPIERIRNTNIIELSRDPVSINSVQAKRTDDSYFTNISNYRISGRVITLNRAYDEIKVDFTIEQEDFFDPQISQDVFNNSLKNFNRRNSIALLNTAVFNSQLDRLSIKSTQIGNSLGNTLGGFVSLVEDPIENSGTTTQPVVSIMSDNVPGLSVKRSLSNENDVTTLTGETAEAGLLDVVICTGNPKGIEQALKTALSVSDARVRRPIIEASPLPDRTVEAVKKNIPVEVSNESQKINQKALRNIGLPFKSDSRLGFGSLGSSFGNILSAVVNKLRNVTPSQNFGDVAKPFEDSVIIPPEYPNLPNVTEANGSTNVSKIVDAGRKTSAQVKNTIDAYRIGSDQNKFLGTNTSNDYTFERVDTQEELERELRSTTREITAAVIDWTDTYTNNNLNAKLVHKLELQRAITNYGNEYASSLGIKGGIQYHFVIMRDGSIERGRPINIEVSDVNPWNKRSVYVGFVAGIDAPEGTEDERLYRSQSSITPAQWKSFNIFLETFFKVIPGGEAIGKKDLTGTEQDIAPGFDVQEYSKTIFGKTTVYANIKTTNQPKTSGEIPNTLPLETAVPIGSPIVKQTSANAVLKNKDKTIDPLTGKFTLPSEAELNNLASGFNALTRNADQIIRNQAVLFNDIIKRNDLGEASRITNKARNDELLNNVDNVINTIDKNRSDLLNNGYIYNEETNSWSKS